MLQDGIQDESGKTMQSSDFNYTQVCDKAYPYLINRVLSKTGLSGLLFAAIFSALMSSLSSVFNSASTIFTLDVYKKYDPHASEEKLVRVGRCSVVVLGIVSLLWLRVIPLFNQVVGTSTQLSQHIPHASYATPFPLYCSCSNTFKKPHHISYPLCLLCSSWARFGRARILMVRLQRLSLDLFWAGSSSLLTLLFKQQVSHLDLTGALPTSTFCKRGRHSFYQDCLYDFLDYPPYRAAVV